MARHRSPSGPTLRWKQLTSYVGRVLGERRASLPSMLHPGPHSARVVAARRRVLVAAATVLGAAAVLVASQPITAGNSLDAMSPAASDPVSEAAQAALSQRAASGGQSSRGQRPAGATPIAVPAAATVPPGEEGIIDPDLSESGGADGPTGPAAVGGGECPTSGFGGVRPHVAQAGYHLIEVFGLSESAVGGVASRPSNPSSDHPRGLALDFTVGNETGDALAAYAEQNADALGINYILWQVPAHYDHVHISFNAQPGSGLPC